MIYYFILFLVTFFFVLSMIFSIISKLLNIDEIFKTKAKVKRMYLICSRMYLICSTDDAEEFFDEFSDWMDYQNLDDSIIIKEFTDKKTFLSFLRIFGSTKLCYSHEKLSEIKQVISGNPLYYSFDNSEYKNVSCF